MMPQTCTARPKRKRPFIYWLEQERTTRKNINLISSHRKHNLGLNLFDLIFIYFQFLISIQSYSIEGGTFKDLWNFWDSPLPGNHKCYTQWNVYPKLTLFAPWDSDIVIANPDILT